MPATKVKTGFSVNCPRCHDTDATVTLDLNNLAECRCSGCDETFSPIEARDLWRPSWPNWEVCRWVELGLGGLTQ